MFGLAPGCRARAVGLQEAVCGNKQSFLFLSLIGSIGQHHDLAVIPGRAASSHILAVSAARAEVGRQSSSLAVSVHTSTATEQINA